MGNLQGFKRKAYTRLGAFAENIRARGQRRIGQRSFVRRRSQRTYAAAAYDRLSKDWRFSETTADVELYAALRIMRGRSRELHRNDDYFRRFVNMLKTNVIGHEGVRLQAGYRKKNGKDPDLDSIKKIEKAWKRWGKRGTASVCGTMSLWATACQVVERWAVDGEVLVQLLPGWDNAFGFAIKVIEADQLDLIKNEVLPNGNVITMGVEKTSYGKPVAYHILSSHPGNSLNHHLGAVSERIDARYIIHIFQKARPDQSRGEPIVVSAMRRLRQLGAYEEAELVAARIAASKMGFYKTSEGGAFDEEGVDDEGNPIEKSKDFTTTAEPGTFEVLPDGYDFVSWDPQHPNSSFGDFSKSILRGVSSGFNVSYVGLSNNLEGVSYSSIRSGEMSDRDGWRVIQKMFVEQFYEEIFQAWLPMAIASGALDLPMSAKDKWAEVNWQPRGWGWVDPDKEIKAKERSVSNSFESLYDVVAETGRDLDDVLEANARARDRAKDLGLKLPVFEGVHKRNETNSGTDQKPAD